MAQYAILRFAKYKGPEISGIEAHNERTKEKYASNPDIDPTRTHLNFHLIKPERRYRAECEKQIAEAGCRTRSDSVRVVEALITATPEFFKGKKRAEIREFFNEALEFIRQNQSPELERGESASETGRDHIPTRVFKQMARLNKQHDKLAELLSDI